MCRAILCGYYHVTPVNCPLNYLRTVRHKKVSIRVKAWRLCACQSLPGNMHGALTVGAGRPCSSCGLTQASQPWRLGAGQPPSPTHPPSPQCRVQARKAESPGPGGCELNAALNEELAVDKVCVAPRAALSIPHVCTQLMHSAKVFAHKVADKERSSKALLKWFWPKPQAQTATNGCGCGQEGVALSMKMSMVEYAKMRVFDGSLSGAWHDCVTMQYVWVQANLGGAAATIQRADATGEVARITRNRESAPAKFWLE
eukprot:366229-Chlamydomonas_euryale.AAC.40